MTFPKIICFYLPQFHQIKENDEWRGEGFTERVNVKKAIPLYQGHDQPKMPYSYYNLLDRDARERQSKLAKEFGVYGFCYYHYWFEGKKILEKPLESMLQDGEPDISFCLSRANHSWTRTWGGEGKDEMLIQQTYGLEEDRENHFNYLYNFFIHKNYILLENKPVFLIYNIKEIAEYDSMIEYWNVKAQEKGFDGIYILETLNSFAYKKQSELTKGVVQFEPLLSFKKEMLSTYEKIQLSFNIILRRFHCFKPFVFDYDILWERILQFQFSEKSNLVKCFYGGFVNWDNTPRKERRGYVVTGDTPKKFGKYLSLLIEKSKKDENEFVFINAWNEWAEGCYLEPDVVNGSSYGDEIKRTFGE